MPLKPLAQTLFLLPPQPQAEGPLNARKFKCKKVYPSLSFVTGEIQEQWTPSWKSNFEFFHSCLQGPPPHFSKLPQNSATTWIMWTAMLCFYQTHVEQTLLPPFRPKAGLNSHKYTQGALILNPHLEHLIKITLMFPPRPIDSGREHKWWLFLKLHLRS